MSWVRAIRWWCAATAIPGATTAPSRHRWRSSRSMRSGRRTRRLSSGDHSARGRDLAGGVEQSFLDRVRCRDMKLIVARRVCGNLVDRVAVAHGAGVMHDMTERHLAAVAVEEPLDRLGQIGLAPLGRLGRLEIGHDVYGSAVVAESV